MQSYGRTTPLAGNASQGREPKPEVAESIHAELLRAHARLSSLVERLNKLGDHLAGSRPVPVDTEMEPEGSVMSTVRNINERLDIAEDLMHRAECAIG